MIRILFSLTIAASFNVIALLIFVSSYDAPVIADNIGYQQFIWTVVAFILFFDCLALYVLMRPGRLPHEEFDAAFKRHYDGTNYEEAFNKAYKAWRERTGS